MRSKKHPCWYRVGRWRGRDVYWHPAQGYAREEHNSYLVELTDLSEVLWFDDEDDYAQILKAVEESQGRLREAMDEELLLACGAKKETCLR